MARPVGDSGVTPKRDGVQHRPCSSDAPHVCPYFGVEGEERGGTSRLHMLHVAAGGLLLLLHVVHHCYMQQFTAHAHAGFSDQTTGPVTGFQ